MPRIADRVKLTDTFVAQYITDKKDDAVWDSEVDGFGFRCRDGAKTFIFRYSVGGRGGRQYRMTLGATDAVKISAARKKAKELRAEVDLGGNPKASIQARIDTDKETRSIPTLNQLSLRYLNEYALLKKSRFEQDVYRLRRLGFITSAQVHDFGNTVYNNKDLPDQKREYGKRLSNYKSQKPPVHPGLANKRIDLITEDDISRLHVMGSATQTEANRRREIIRKMFNIAQGWYPKAVVKNPAVGTSITPYEEGERERFLTRLEISRLIQALYAVELENGQRYSTSINAIRMIMFTGARPSEVYRMKWSQLDLEEAVWSKPASTTKQKRLHHIPIAQDAISLLNHIKLLSGHSEYVFPSRTSPTRPIGEVKKTWSRVIATAEIENEFGTRLYDLRHTFATLLVAGGQSLFSVGKLLGHSTTKVTERYAHADIDGLRAVLGSMDQVFSDAANVTALPKRDEL
ncbi:tyrosine-type recombinase/integrase [Sneathiella sp.]|uniref:tyrosine-type recombinase/integrase n=1 Tax=Sneathiella sp. TaxID=1964365 RepID=UPI003566D109